MGVSPFGGGGVVVFEGIFGHPKMVIASDSF